MSCVGKLSGHAALVQSLILGKQSMVTGSRDRHIKAEGESGLKRWSGHMMHIFGSIARRYVHSLKIYKHKSQWNPKLVKIRINSENNNITIVNKFISRARTS